MVLTSNEFRLLISKLNRIDEKLEQLSRKVTMMTNRGGSATGGHRDLPTMPEGMKLPADTVKDLKAASSILLQNDRSGKNLVRYPCLLHDCS